MLDTFGPVFAGAGFELRPLEWWDAPGTFHHRAWDPEDGPVDHSSQLEPPQRRVALG
ncbi:hypothetical protein K7W42_17575 [Deinococcus sp. HMF7604]|uniref:hypothetical protein n=1 Tax=Deinococcus betulae TaxID=2873312 RepID=UPI001CCE5FFA|nr:hypothetical protein [Deinococcus betulae]MBZ9752656.1 hypothetical protein [Deinococcus betulae]